MKVKDMDNSAIVRWLQATCRLATHTKADAADVEQLQSLTFKIKVKVIDDSAKKLTTILDLQLHSTFIVDLQIKKRRF